MLRARRQHINAGSAHASMTSLTITYSKMRSAVSIPPSTGIDNSYLRNVASYLGSHLESHLASHTAHNSSREVGNAADTHRRQFPSLRPWSQCLMNKLLHRESLGFFNEAFPSAILTQAGQSSLLHYVATVIRVPRLGFRPSLCGKFGNLGMSMHNRMLVC